MSFATYNIYNVKGMTKNNQSKIVAVAMSGGVDSSVAAALLIKQGFRVFGITMKTFCYQTFSCGSKACCGQEGIESAKQVCRILGIPHYTVDVSKEFTKKVIDDFISEYKAGRTPNPCVKCNQFIKFDLLLKLAEKHGAEFLATGHYARIRRKIPKSKFPTRADGPTGRMGQIPIFHLLRGKDKNKDQSYFLCNLNQEQLSKIIFPLGNLKKEEVRDLARKFKLPAAEKPESQEICFVNTNLSEFLSSRINANPGDIVETSGRILGKHHGLAFYTIGQRAGVGGKGPYYVAKIDKKKNQLVVTNSPKDPIILRDAIMVSRVHWIVNFQFPIPNFQQKFKIQNSKSKMVEIQIRYKSKPAFGQIFNLGKNKVKIMFLKPVFAPAPGQSAVFYKGDECLGGGIIE